MPYSLNSLEKMLLITLNKGPAPILDIFNGAAFHVVNAAVKLDIFKILNEKPLTAAELAGKIKAEETGIGVLLEVLDSLGYIKKQAGVYRNTNMTQKWMSASSALDFSIGFEYYYPLMQELWPYLHETVLTGKPGVNFYTWLGKNPSVARSYQVFMMNMAVYLMPDLLKKLKLAKDCRHLIDIGGGHALYSIALCKKYNNLRVTIFDSPYVEPIALENIKKAQLTDRIQFVRGDYLQDDIGRGYDAALLCNVAHEHPGEVNERLISKVSKSLSDGGCIMVVDNLRSKKISKAADYMMRMYSLLFFLSLGGRSYSYTEIAEWLEKSGSKKVGKTGLGITGLNVVMGHY